MNDSDLNKSALDPSHNDMFRPGLNQLRNQWYPLFAARNATTLSNLGVALATSTVAQRSLMNETIPNPFQLKYAEKLQEKAKSQGFRSAEELLRHYESQKKEAEREEFRKSMELYNAKGENKSLNFNTSLPPHVKKLNDIIVYDKIKNESKETIEKLWVAFHSTKNAISAVIPKDMYKILHSRSIESPKFVLPVFQADGNADNYLLEHSGHQTFFTSLLSYQTHGSEAPVLLTLTYYTDLMESKDIVLLRGELDIEKCPMETAKRLTQGMRNFYLGDEYVLVQQMHQNPKEFEFNNVVKLVKAHMQAETQ